MMHVASKSTPSFAMPTTFVIHLVDAGWWGLSRLTAQCLPDRPADVSVLLKLAICLVLMPASLLHGSACFRVVSEF